MDVFHMLEVRWADSIYDLTSFDISHRLTADWISMQEVYAFEGNIYVFGC